MISEATRDGTRWRRLAVAAAFIFLLGFGARVLSWHDARFEAGKVQSAVVADYKRAGMLWHQEGAGAFFDPASPLADPDLMGHPPGYPILWALNFAAFGESDASMQFFQIACDALAAVLLLLIAAELLPFGASVVAGLLVALAPQLTWNSVLLLPDTLSVLPLLLSIYCLARARVRPRLAWMLAAGAFVGLSCWLRANALLLAPFLCIAVALLFERGRRLRMALAVVFGAVTLIAPLTLRNWVVFDHFIPLSLGAGQTMLEGIADYDEQGRFGIPATDLGIMKQEAEAARRPDYAEVLFGPEGIKRERSRLARAFGVIRSNPFWFAGVMARRAASMLRLERSQLIEAGPAVTHSPAEAECARPAWQGTPRELIAGAASSPGARLTLTQDGNSLLLVGDESKYGDQLTSAPVDVKEDTDYLLSLPVKIERGRAFIKVTDVGSGRTYASSIIETAEGLEPEEQPTRVISVPFVSGGAGAVRLVVSNGGSVPVAQFGTAKLFALGPASHLWTRVPRAVLRNVQKLFVTAVALPLYLAGILLLVRARRFQALVVLLVVPAYYFCVQSAVHTEYRYVLAIHYLLSATAATALYCAAITLWRGAKKLRASGEVGSKG